MAQATKQFLVDEKGRKRSVVMPMAEYRDLMEDLQDLALIAERRDESAEPWDKVKRRVEKKWRPTQSK